MFKKLMNICLVFVLIIPNIIIPDMRVTVKAQTLGDVERELEQYKADYEQNRLDREYTEAEMAEAQRKIKVANDEIIEANNQILQLNEEIDALNVEIAQKNEEIKKKNEEIKSIMNFFQKSNGEAAYLEYAFGAKDFTDFIYRIAISEQLTNYNKNLIKEYQRMVDECQQKIEENNRKTEELNQRKIELANRQKELENLLSTLSHSLAEYEDERVNIEEEIRMKEDAIQMYKDMGCESEDDLDVCTAQKLPITTKLYRPLKVGYVTQEFGYPDSQTSQFYSFHGGIDMSTSDDNTPVYAAGEGLVVAVSRNQSCGNNIVYIQHRFADGSTYTTSYWHLRRVYVYEGDRVTKDTQIGIMGGAWYDYDACALGAHLHFVIATGLYLQDYYYISTFNARRINPRTLVNFPSLYVRFNDRLIKY